MGFSADLSNFSKDALLSTDRTRRAAVIAIVNRLAKRTPVDKGRAAGNWFTSVSAPSTESTLTARPRDSIARAISTDMGGLEDTVFITNNLPYIGALNNGTSRKAPRGFVQTAVLDVKNLLRKNGKID